MRLKACCLSSAAVSDEVSSTGLRDVQLSISGMTCAACAARVQKKLGQIPGVVASVNFATERATVTAPISIELPRLVHAVEQAGYGAEPVRQAPGQIAADEAGPDAARVAYLRRRLIVALVFFVPLSDLSVQLSLFPAFRFPGWQWVLIALAVPVAGWAAWPFHAAAAKAARHGATSMDTLVSIGIVAACGWSAYAMFVLDARQARASPLQLLVHASGGGIYLEVAASVTTFLLAGRWYEARARRDAGDAMRELAAAGAKEACLLQADGTERRVPAAELRPGGRFIVRPGEVIAADGVVEFGESAVDTSTMTGEAVPNEAGVGGRVTAGTVVVTGRLIIRATETGNDTQLAHLIALVERAQADKSAVQRLADRICGVFVPAVLAASALTLVGWLVAGAPAERGFSAALAVLIIACPCALGLATPAALVVACGRGAQLGIFIKGYQALEASRSVDTVLLDKTGVLTTGMMAVSAVQAAPGTDRAWLLRSLGSVEDASGHPVAVAISDFARAELGALSVATDFESLPGLGVRGVVDGIEVIVGRDRLFRDRSISIPKSLADRCAEWAALGQTVVLAGWGGQARGAVAVADTLKPSAAAAVRELRRLGLHTMLLTGDSEVVGQAVGAAVGVDEVIAGALPDGKAAVVADLQAQGRQVAMAGDGTNDGPALAAADLGLALGSGTDVAISAADLILLRDDLRVVPEAVSLAREAHRVIRRNLAWAFGYNVAAIPLAAVGLLNPLIAGAAMAASSAFVVASSVRLRRFGGAAPRGHARIQPAERQYGRSGTSPTESEEETVSCPE
ncbi:MAG TPA: heavy metal translocating P-type ATPase [Streptosporangiaceae bacterium]|nr:heavy metal translocating P-type ATPase [Streptosporangiaceae bacterium]